MQLYFTHIPVQTVRNQLYTNNSDDISCNSGDYINTTVYWTVLPSLFSSIQLQVSMYNNTWIPMAIST